MATDVSTFQTPISWVVLNVGGSELAVGVFPQATCRACDSAPVVLGRRAGRFFIIIGQNKYLSCRRGYSLS
jgi:hypothetical protein